MDYGIYQEITQSYREHINDEYDLWFDDDIDNTEPQLTNLQQKEAMNFKEKHPNLCEYKSLETIFTLYLGEF